MTEKSKKRAIPILIWGLPISVWVGMYIPNRGVPIPIWGSFQFGDQQMHLDRALFGLLYLWTNLSGREHRWVRDEDLTVWVLRTF